MPRLDKTGPEGEGPLTGRGLGKCSKKDFEEKVKRYVRRGKRGRGRGRGRGFGKMDGTGPRNR